MTEYPTVPDPGGRNEIGKWWASLSDAAQRRLRQRPHDPVPAHLAQEIIRSALLTTGHYWPTTYPANYNLFRVPQEVAVWILDFGRSDERSRAGDGPERSRGITT